MSSISIEKFRQLPEDAKQRGKKVDYAKVIKAVLGKPMTIRGIQKLMLEHSRDKEKVHYSEATRFLKTLEKQGYKITTKWKVNNRGGSSKYILVQKSEK